MLEKISGSGMITVQPDWKEAFAEDCKTWVRYKEAGGKAVDDKLEKDDNDVRSVDGKFEAEYDGGNVLTIRHPDSGIRVVNVAPDTCYTGLTGGKVSSDWLGPLILSSSDWLIQLKLIS